ncbi:tetratricopeptide repeat protein 1 [Agrilus planipennis]|uniref:Tetratricopeptide repeat protein 1 n=1 Tax=Agrilus planipennis TaxID=224129 RepID=A0A1W4W4R3_AGRPL|nr:tetratricopeptide repeat protein 1 [Agrilus planipennis]
MTSNKSEESSSKKAAIDELIQGVENTTINESESQKSVDIKDDVHSFDHSVKKLLKENDHTGQANSESNEDDTDIVDDEMEENESDNLVDEEFLRNLEVTLTPEELENRHKESLNLKEKGNQQFKSEFFIESVETYTKALQICPLNFKYDRSIFYCNRAASKIKLNKVKSAIGDCSKAIELNSDYVRAYMRRAKLYEDSDKLDEALADYKKVLELDSGNKEAIGASVRLPPLINERNEKMKAEMFGKLKDLGNMILRPFGLSTDNFQVQQDPSSGGYSINFQQSRPK